MMEDKYVGRCGPQRYLLSQKGYQALQDLHEMLALMAHITYNEDNAENGHAKMTIGRAELYFVFELIISKLDEGMEHLVHENWLGTENPTWQ